MNQGTKKNETSAVIPAITPNQDAHRGIFGAASVASEAAIIIAPMPMILEDLRTGALVPILTEFLLKQYSIDVLYPHREHLPAKVRTFIDLLAKRQ